MGRSPCPAPLMRQGVIMRHRKNSVKLGRSMAHRKALMASLVCGLIEQQRIETTLPKAKQARSLAEKMVTLAKKNTLASRRQALSFLHHRDCVSKLFATIGPHYHDRAGGYTRIMRKGRRGSDSAEVAIVEWVDLAPVKKEKKTAVTTENKDESKS